ncbi:MAG: hypothetical protein QM619_12965, partial [Micropruina sp.]|uniref:hypothetical protein n=1 Tax=Micropruina sp. TaxID=2737536 RepID=UPI0039E21701
TAHLGAEARPHTSPEAAPQSISQSPSQLAEQPTRPENSLQALIYVSGVQSAPSPQVVAAVQQVAKDHGVAIGRSIDDIREPGRLRYLYLAVGDQAATQSAWLRYGYPSFTQDIRTTVRPFHDLVATDARGYYLVFGNHFVSEVVMERFRDLGFEVKSRAYYDASSIIRWLGNQPLGLSVLVSGLLVALLITASVIAAVKSYAVQRLHGANYANLLIRDLRWVLRFATLTLVAVTIIAIITLGLYNQYNQWLPFAILTACTLCGLIGVAILTHAIALAIARGMPILESLKGRIPARWATLGVYLVRLPAMALAVGSVILSALAVNQLSAYQESRDMWRTAGEAVYINFNPSMTSNETDEMSIRTGEWLATEETAGRMILAYQDRFERLIGGPAGDLLIVNDNYLKAQDIRNADGQRILDVGGDHILIVLPPSLAAQEELAIRATQEWADSTAGRPDAVSIVTTNGASGLRAFTYGNPVVHDQNALLNEPTILVVNAAASVIDADTYTAFASQGGVVLEDMSQAVAGAATAGISPFILGFRPAAQDAAAMYGDLIRELRIHAFNVAAALGVLLATAVGLTEIYTRKNAQRTFARFISGWRFARSHIVILAGELALACLTLGWSASQTLPLLLADRTDATPNNPADTFLLGGWQPALLTGLAGANFIFFLAALHIKTRRLILTRSPEAQA